MPTLAPERRAEEIIAGWRSGLDDDNNPAGPRYDHAFTEYEITLTGGGDPNTEGITHCGDCVITFTMGYAQSTDPRINPVLLPVCCPGW